MLSAFHVPGIDLVPKEKQKTVQVVVPRNNRIFIRVVSVELESTSAESREVKLRFMNADSSPGPVLVSADGRNFVLLNAGEETELTVKVSGGTARLYIIPLVVPVGIDKEEPIIFSFVYEVIG